MKESNNKIYYPPLEKRENLDDYGYILIFLKCIGVFLVLILWVL